MVTVAELTEQLKRGPRPERVAAAEALSRLADGAQAAIPALVLHAAAADEELREWCVAALEHIGPPANDQLEEMTRLAKAADATIAYWALTLLGRAGDSAAEAVPVAIDRLADATNPALQQRAAWALGEIGRAAPETIAALSEAAMASGPLAAHAKAALARLPRS